jgi:hypothetical protein
MSEINYFKVFVLRSGDVAADMDHLYIKENLLRTLSRSSLYS